MMIPEPNKWKLIKCTYDYMGMSSDEIETPEQMDMEIKEGYSVGYFIGAEFDFKGKKVTRVLLEGDKEVLDYVLDKINPNYFNVEEYYKYYKEDK